MSDALRKVPRTDILLADPRLAPAVARLGRKVVKAAVKRAQDRLRRGEIPPDEVIEAACRDLPPTATSLRPVINATGVLLHTNLGRAPLSDAARGAVLAASGTTDVEYDLATGQRGQRGAGALAALAEAVPEAEAIHLVNNNAAALALVATVLAQGQELVVSRGELVEIGDGFRLPDLLASTGAWLREVGTTNRTVLADYQAAVGPHTGCVLKIHPSNFRVEGFTEDVGVRELATLGVPVVYDIGSGLLSPDPLFPCEPDARTALRDGADLVTASGDKLLGGPQAGLLFGQKSLVERLRRHPLARALRVDKLTLAALEATLRGPEPPTRLALHADPEVLRARADKLAGQLAAAGIAAEAVRSDAVVGGGGAPGVRLASAAVSLPAGYGPALRRADPPVIARVERGRCLLDLRAVAESDDPVLHSAVLSVSGCT